MLYFKRKSLIGVELFILILFAKVMTPLNYGVGKLPID